MAIWNPFRNRPHPEEDIAQRTAELSATRNFLDGIANTSAGVIFAIAPDGRFEFVNDRGAAITGYSREELLQRQFLMLFSPEQHAAVMADFTAVLGGASVYGREHALTRKDGEIRWIEYSVAPVKQGDKVIRGVGTASDITERKQSALAIEASERKLRAVLDATTEGILLVDAQTRKVVLPNRTICEMLGYSPAEIALLSVNDIHPAESLPYVIRQFERQARGEIKVATDMPVLRKDGSVFFADISTSSMMLGDRPCMVGAFHDITERKRTEEALRASHAMLTTTERIASIGGFDWDLVQDVLTWSEEVYPMFGLDPQQGAPTLNNFIAVVHAEDRQRMQVAIEASLARNEPFDLEFRIIRPDGEERIIHSQAEIVRDAAGQALRMTGTSHDITERKRQERELLFNNVVLATQMETSLDGILVVDQESHVVSHNKRFLEVWGIPLELAGTRDDARFLQAVVGKMADPESFLTRVRYLYEHKEEKSHEEVTLKDGTILDRYSAPLIAANGEYFGRVWYFRDITERKRAEEIIRASLTEKEALLREIHHRVKNNMQVVISLLNLEVGKIADPAVVQMLRDGQRRIEVMALVHEKLHQSRDLSQVDAKAYIEDLAHGAFHAHERSGARVRLALDVEPVGLGLDAATPCGLIVNELISNALKHAFPGDAAGEIRIALHAADGGEIELAISDDGIGIPAEFDWGGAQTLGLRLVRNLVERQLQGQLELDRAHGTAWRIRFGN